MNHPVADTPQTPSGDGVRFTFADAAAIVMPPAPRPALTPLQAFTFTPPAIPGAATPAERALHSAELAEYYAIPWEAADFEAAAEAAASGAAFFGEPLPFEAGCLREAAARLRQGDAR